MKRVLILLMLVFCVLQESHGDESATANPDLWVYTETSANGQPVQLWRGEKWQLDVVNWWRASAGLPPVKIDPALQDRVRAHCLRMAKARGMFHSGRGGENVAVGQANNAEAVQVWVNSPPHAVQIFNPRHTVVGVACYQFGGRKFYVQEFH